MNRLKSFHFCTEKLLEKINTGDGYILTIRTGWTPSIYPNDIINLKDNTKDGKIIRTGKVVSIIPIKFKNIDTSCKEEILRYNRKFNPEHFFFKIIIKLNKKFDVNK